MEPIITQKLNWNKDNVDVVMFHGSCSDGFGAAFSVWYYFKSLINFERVEMKKLPPFGKKYGDAFSAIYYFKSQNAENEKKEIQFIPCYHLKEDEHISKDFLDKISGKNILVCDFSYPYESLVQLINVSTSFLILDHHKTAKADLEKIPDNLKIFDMDRSGSKITWQYYNADKSLPKFLAHVNDRDIWEKKMEQNDEFIAYFYEQEFDCNLWETYLDESNVEKAITKGSAWLEYQKIIIDKIIRKASYIIHEINDKYYIVLYSNSSELKSDIGNKLFNRYPFGDFSTVWHYNLYKNETEHSLRSTADRFDVSVIAKMYGGGGHRNASATVLNGNIPMFPLPRIDDEGIFSVFKSAVVDTIKIFGKESTYVLFKVNEIKNEWIEDKFMNLIKRKYKQCEYVIFQTPSDMVNFKKDKQEVVQLQKYHLMYNEVGLSNPIKQLQHMVLNTYDKFLIFDSEKDFRNLWISENNIDGVDITFSEPAILTSMTAKENYDIDSDSDVASNDEDCDEDSYEDSESSDESSDETNKETNVDIDNN